jgi:DNA-binding response OmpR family regulator
MYSLLLIEDDQKIGNLLTEYMDKMGHQLTHALRPSLGLEQLKENTFDLIILDIMLPEMDGFQVCKEIRKSSNIPILMLTARGDVTDRIVGLELGADDYLPKPFDPRELLARIESILRRSSTASVSQAKWSAYDLEVDFQKRNAYFKNENLELTTMEFELLKVFIENEQVVLSRDDIMNKLQGIDADVFSRSIDIAVSRLRNKLHEDSKKPRFIKTVWGTGYIFLGGKGD